MTSAYTRREWEQLMSIAASQDALKQLYDHIIQEYVDNGLIPQQLVGEARQNTTGADIMKWIENQILNPPTLSPALRDLDSAYLWGTSGKCPNGILASKEEPRFIDNRFHNCRPVIQNEGFVKLNPVSTAGENPEFERHYMGRWQIGIDLAEDRDFTPTED